MRVVRGLAALIILIGLLIGIPVGLLAFGGNPLPTSMSWDGLAQPLLRPASDRALIGLVTIIGWIAWAGFAASVAAELINTTAGRKVQLQLPGLGFGQKLAATLIVAVVTMIAVPTPMQTATAQPNEPTPSPSATSSSAPVTAPTAAPSSLAPGGASQATAGDRMSGEKRATAPKGSSSAEDVSSTGDRVRTGDAVGPQTRVHVVERGEYLWSLAERYLGDGSRWKEIVDANPGMDRDHLTGQRLIIPGAAGGDRGNNPGDNLRNHVAHREASPEKPDTTNNRTRTTKTDERGARDRWVPVHEGDTVTLKGGNDSLWRISDDLYGDPHLWPEIYRENRDEIEDPDLIDTGHVLDLPSDRERLANTEHKVTHRHRDLDREADETREQTEGDTARQTEEKPAHQAGQPTESRVREQSVREQAARERTPQQARTRANIDRGGGSASSDGNKVASSAGTAGSDQGPAVCAPGEVPGVPSAAAPSAPPPLLPTAASAQPSTTQLPPPTGSSGPGTPAPVVLPDSAVQPRTAATVTVGLLLAAGLITTVNLRRRRQLRARRPGRRIPSPAPAAGQFEDSVKAIHQPLRVEQLDQVTRAIAAHSHNTGAELPAISAVRVADDRIDLLFSRPAENPPSGIEIAADGSVWTLHAADLSTVLTVAGIDDATPPYPALVTLGRDAATAHVLVDLEAAGALTITAADDDTAAAMMATIALELAMSPWAGDLNLTFVGQLLPGLAAALDHPAVTHVDDVEHALSSLEDRAAAQRPYLTENSVGQKRADPDLADAWCPHVVIFGQQLEPTQTDRLSRIVTDLPRVAIAAVTTDPAITPWRFDLNTAGTGHLTPHDWTLTPPLITAEQYQDILNLVATSGSEDTTPAPWWDHNTHGAATDQTADLSLDQTAETAAIGVESRALPSATLAVLRAKPSEQTIVDQPLADDEPAKSRSTSTSARTETPRSPLNLHALIGPDQVASSGSEHGDEAAHLDDRLDPNSVESVDDPQHPTLRILGLPDLVGARGAPNRRYQQRSLEFLLFLLEHPGATSARLRSHFNISRDYTKTVISNLRKTLGSDPDGHPYLPDITPRSGYRLHDQVTSDWHYASLLLGRGVNTAASEVLVKVLSMLRSRPLEGAEDWVDTGILRTDIESKITDAAHVLATRALTDNDLRLARWATSRGLVADPESETLLTDKLRIEQQAGNRADVQRIARRISANARAIGANVCDETREVLRAVATR